MGWKSVERDDSEKWGDGWEKKYKDEAYIKNESIDKEQQSLKRV